MLPPTMSEGVLTEFLLLIALSVLFLLVACRPGGASRTTPVAVRASSPPGGEEGAVVIPLTPAPSATPTVARTATSQPGSEAEPSPTPSVGRVADADVLYVRAVQAADGSWTFQVTVRHPDTGWEDYADGWDVVTPEGTVLKPDPDSPFTRLLLHPHVNEQPFTRSQSRIVIPDGITQVRVRAHDLVDGYGGREVLVDLTVGSGPDFEVKRK